MMARLTLRLPESLHDVLTHRAEEEGVSLNQFLVYELTKVTAIEDVAAQRARFDAMRQRVPAADSERALEQLLAEREPEARPRET